MRNEDEKYWKWNFIYYNPEDTRLFVPKRISWLGWTLNFANPFAYLVLALSLFIVGIIPFFIR